MLNVDALKEAITALPDNEYAELRQWFADRDWEKWDRQIEADSNAGRLNFLVREAANEKHEGRLRDL